LFNEDSSKQLVKCRRTSKKPITKEIAVGTSNSLLTITALSREQSVASYKKVNIELNNAEYEELRQDLTSVYMVQSPANHHTGHNTIVSSSHRDRHSTVSPSAGQHLESKFNIPHLTPTFLNEVHSKIS